jgi:hypothetical protein
MRTRREIFLTELLLRDKIHREEPKKTALQSKERI